MIDVYRPENSVQGQCTQIMNRSIYQIQNNRCLISSLPEEEGGYILRNKVLFLKILFFVFKASEKTDNGWSQEEGKCSMTY